MTAKEFFESQLTTDSSSVIDKYAHIFNRSQLIRFAEAYHDSEVKKLNMPAVIKSLPEYNEILYHAKTLSNEQFREYWNDVQGNVL